ncbi:MAG: hypothetical protein HY908_16590 [Myxococcales bacterium]|nr:hypothetical protein [Myxococcales bacterium]
MAARGFYAQDARQRAAAVVRDIERGTGAEVVVAVRPRAAEYHAGAYLVGALAALAVLCALVWLPFDFAYDSWPFEVGLAFVLGTALGLGLPPVRRLFTTRRRMRAEVRRSALGAFFELGVGRTRERTGVLVFVALLEREVEVVADHGIDFQLCGEAWERAQASLRASLRGGLDLERFLAALGALGAPLAEAAPRREDDVNELPDEMDVA